MNNAMLTFVPFFVVTSMKVYSSSKKSPTLYPVPSVWTKHLGEKAFDSTNLQNMTEDQLAAIFVEVAELVYDEQLRKYNQQMFAGEDRGREPEPHVGPTPMTERTRRALARTQTGTTPMSERTRRALARTQRQD